MKKMFEIPEYNSSKEEEVNFLRKLEGSLNSNTYLASLINPSLIDWFHWAVRDDVSCDIVKALEFAQKQRNAEVEISSKLRAEVEHANKAVGLSADVINAKNLTIAQLEDRIAGLYEDLQDARDELKAGEILIEHRDTTIVELKARLYDLMTKE